MNTHELTRRKVRINTNRGNLILEYTILIAIVIAALVSMQVYVKRAVCGRFRQAGDTFGSGRQYEPNLTKIK